MQSELSRPRAIAHVDLDAFYTQVEVQRNPAALQGQPVVVVQYNPFGDLTTLLPEQAREFPDSNGSIIAVSYEARRYGVKRNMMAQEGKKLCPNLHIVQVPVAHGKADLTIYREAGAQVAAILSRMSVCERASIDEVYLDVTEAAAARLAALPAGSSPPAPASFDGVHVLGASSSREDTHTDSDEDDGDGTDDAKSDDLSDAEGQTVAVHHVQQPADAQLVQPHLDVTDAATSLPVTPVTSGPSNQAATASLKDRALTRPDQDIKSAVAVAAAAAATDDTAAAAAEAWWTRSAADWAPHEALLAAGAQVVWELRQAVQHELGYSCSAGISHYKILAKLGSGMHKPAQQTIVPAASIPSVLKDLPLKKLRGLGGQFGRLVEQQLGTTTCGGVWEVPVSRLETLFGKRGPWLARLVWGIDAENDIKPRMLPKQISCGKTFRGHTALRDVESVSHWLAELAGEVADRCEADRKENQRMPSNLAVAVTNQPGGDGSPATNFTRSCPLTAQPNTHALTATAVQLFRKWSAERPGWRVTSLFLTAGNFLAAPTTTITRFFAAKRGAGSTAVGSAPSSGSPAGARAPSKTAAHAAHAPLPAQGMQRQAAKHPLNSLSSLQSMQHSPGQQPQHLHDSTEPLHQRPVQIFHDSSRQSGTLGRSTPMQVLYPPESYPDGGSPAVVQAAMSPYEATTIPQPHDHQPLSVPASQQPASLATWLPASQPEVHAAGSTAQGQLTGVGSISPGHVAAGLHSPVHQGLEQMAITATTTTTSTHGNSPSLRDSHAALPLPLQSQQQQQVQQQERHFDLEGVGTGQQAWRPVSGWDVDQAVLSELPEDIQAEIRASLHLPPMQLSRPGSAGMHGAAAAGLSSHGQQTGGKRAHRGQGSAEARPSKSIRAFFSSSKKEK